MWKIFFTYRDKSKCTVKGKGIITPELAVKVRFNTRKDKTIWEIKFINKFRSLQKCKEMKSREKKQKEKKIGMYRSGLCYRKGNNVPDRITA